MVKRGIIISFLVLLLVFPVVSADIVLQQQPNDIYNLGDVVGFPLKIISAKDVNSFLSINLLCDGSESIVHKEFVSLKAGNEKALKPQVPLISNFINNSGICKGKIILGGDYILSSQFKVSNKIDIDLENYSANLFPTQEIIFQGEAKKETGDMINNGFIEINISSGNSSNTLKLSDTIDNGLFYINYTFPKNAKAGEYKGSLLIYQKDINDVKINQGSKNIKFNIEQVPTKLELSLEKDKINPNEKLRIKPLLHDQSGEEINKGKVIVTIKDNGRILRQAEGDIGTYFEYEFDSDYPPSSRGSIFAISNRLSSENEFEILAYKKVEVDIINGTLFLENKGNVFYNESVLVQIGGEALEINTSLQVGEIKKYLLSAPNGEYEVKINAGDDEKKKSVALTGNAISIREFTSSDGMNILKKIFIWLFIIFVLGFFAYIVFREVHNENSFLRKRKSKYAHPPVIRKNKKQGDEKVKTFIVNKQNLKEEESASSLINSENMAIVSSSISGDKQKSSLICINIKNLKELRDLSKKDSGKESVLNVFNKIVNNAEKSKAFTYVSDNYVFFIFTPSLTKTFDNEKSAIKIGNKIKETLENHNKLFKNKVDYGISLNTGEIVLNKSEKKLKFMSIGSFIIDSKKISNFTSKDISISKNMNEKIISYAKTDKKVGSDGKTEFYKIREIRDKERHKKFIGEFVKRMEEDKKKSKETNDKK